MIRDLLRDWQGRIILLIMVMCLAGALTLLTIMFLMIFGVIPEDDPCPNGVYFIPAGKVLVPVCH